MIGRAAAPAINMQTQERYYNRMWDLILPAATGLLALIIYGITMAPDLTWAHFGSDGGELITASMTSGIPHPPGYPTYVVLGRLFGLIPTGTVAWRFNLLSAVCAAAAVSFTTATALNTLAGNRRREIVSVATGLTVALAPLLWSQALIAEVYALNLALLSICLWSVLSSRSPFLSGITLGLAITTHLSSLLMLPLVIALIPRSRWKALALGVAAGLTPFLLMPLLAQSDSPVVWGDPTTLPGWWWLVSGRLYHANLRLPETSTASIKAAYLAGSLGQQLAYAGWLFIVLGISTRLVERRTAVALTATALLYLLYGYLYQTNDAIVYLLPTIIILSPLLAAGLAKVGSWSLLLPVALLLLYFQALNLHNERSVRPLAERVLNSAPEEAVLLTAGDQSIFSLWYFQHVEGMRSDLALVDANLLAFDWYRQRLSARYPDLAALEEDDLAAFRRANGRLRPVCDVAPELSGIAGCTSPKHAGRAPDRWVIVIKSS